jgi:hypothetical protein
MLRRRARRLHGGNLSAAIAEGVRRVREEEGREAVVGWLGESGDATEEQRADVRAEWREPDAASRARRRGRMG